MIDISRTSSLVAVGAYKSGTSALVLVRSLIDFKIKVNVAVSNIGSGTISGVKDIMFTLQDDLLVAFSLQSSDDINFMIIYADGTT